MPIQWNEKTRAFHLHNDRVSYIVAIFANGRVGNVHFGGALRPDRDRRHLAADLETFDNAAAERVRLEYPTAFGGDFRVPALAVDLPDGSPVLELVYSGHRIVAGKPPLPGLPATHVEDPAEADTVELELTDAPSGVRVTLRYTIFRDLPAVARSARIENGGARPVTVRCAMSASVDLDGGPWDLVQLSGGWARERQVVRRRVAPGSQGVGSLRGASSHQQNPFVALVRPETSETAGEAYGASLVYSGNFLAEVDADGAGTTRLRVGIHPERFAWRLEPGAELVTPEAVLVHSDAGLGGLSDAYHPLYRTRLSRSRWKERARPVLINNWEGTYFAFTEDKLVEMAAVARDLGVELFVLDDGWFGERDSDDRSLGDWTVNRTKLPGGLEGLAARIAALGLELGLWIEPEMVSPRSRLFAEHPDWALGVPGRRRTQIRNQYVLDLSRPEVADWVYATLARVLGSAPIAYVKWDMNRSMTEPFAAHLPPERQGELFHRYMLGVYSVYERITAQFPDVLFESCAGGGGRFDPGLLAYAPQAWTSDNSDAVERLGIQWGTSLVYPLSAMGAHVSAVPNHQVGRVTPLATRAAVAFFGVFGYELDPTALSAEERVAVAAQIEFYKRHREVLQRGRFLRLVGPFDGDGNETAWMCVADDRRRAIVGFYRVLQRPAQISGRLRLRGLDAAATYRVSTWPGGDDPIDRDNTGERDGDELMKVGLSLSAERGYGTRRGDFWSRLFVLESLG
jgi:alpha-galactosidase